MHTCIHTYIHTTVHTCTQTDMHNNICAWLTVTKNCPEGLKSNIVILRTWNPCAYACMHVCMYVGVYVCEYEFQHSQAIKVANFVWSVIKRLSLSLSLSSIAAFRTWKPRMYVRLYVCMHACLFVFVCVCMYLYVCMYVYMGTCTDPHILWHLFTSIHTHIPPHTHIDCVYLPAGCTACVWWWFPIHAQVAWARSRTQPIVKRICSYTPEHVCMHACMYVCRYVDMCM